MQSWTGGQKGSVRETLPLTPSAQGVDITPLKKSKKKQGRNRLCSTSLNTHER
jgi:hypothetical protein